MMLIRRLPWLRRTRLSLSVFPTGENMVVCRPMSSGSSSGALQPSTQSLLRRIELFEAEKLRQASVLSAVAQGEVLIESNELTAPLVRAPGWSPVEALKHIVKGDDDRPVVAVRVNGQLQGLYDKIKEPGQVQLEFVRFGEPDGTKVFWHSAAHITGAALEAFFGDRVQLCDGPPLMDAEGGYFYEMHLIDDVAASQARGISMDIPGQQLIKPAAAGKKAPGGGAPMLLDTTKLRISDGLYAPIEVLAKKIVSARFQFERLEVTREFAGQLFEGNPFKLDMLSRIPAGEAVSLYRCGPFVDLCRGPHVPNTSLFKGLRMTKSSGSHWNPTQPAGLTAGAAADATSAPTSASQRLVGGELLQRLYGVAFPTAAQLAAWQETVDEAKRRDHRVIGRAQGLFFFHDYSPGSAFMLPHGTRIYNALVSLLRREYRTRGYEEVMSPLVYKPDLWATSGHLDAYAENMFTVTPGMAPALHTQQQEHQCGHEDGHIHAQPAAAAGQQPGEEPEVYGLKPMNCPGHCLIFAHRGVSYRELPVRLADFSSLHRNEASGSLGGLTRLRRFQQDDAHIFCGEEHVRGEVHGCLEFIRHVYRLFGMSFRAKLSTRPETFVGDVATWDRAEEALKSALASSSAAGAPGDTVEVDVGGGAFYGPKIDVFVRDALGREHQCATVQLDFQLPRRFGLSYAAPDGQQRTPVIIHRAILGSLERMMGILIEHTGGKWPFWLSPRQVMVAPVSERHGEYARRVADALRFPPIVTRAAAAAKAAAASGNTPAAAPTGSTQPTSEDTGAAELLGDTGLWVDVDASDRSVPKKVREAQVAQYNLILVVGDAEADAGTATVRFRDAGCQSAFFRALALVDPDAATRLSGPQAGGDSEKKRHASPACTAAGSSSGGGGGGGGEPGASAPGAPPSATLVQLPVETVRAACEEMLRRFM